IETVAEDDDGALWLGSRNGGATRWKDGQSLTLTTSDQLPTNHVTSILPGAGGEVWIGTAKGLVRWQAGRVDAPTAQRTAVSSLYRDRQGALWIGADNG